MSLCYIYVSVYVYTVLFENKIVGLQNELTKCGILKNMSDNENFWKLIQEETCGTETKQKLQNIKFKSLYLSFFNSEFE